jgi:prolyl-tRNA editing enzyme YbaK/EbsC (Cys-tRNA(Pro) deacylase)
MTVLGHPSVVNVAAALKSAGQHAAGEGIRILPTEVRTAAQAAQALETEVAAIANSLVFRASFSGADAPLLVLTSGAHRADTGTLADLSRATDVRMADPAFVKRHTGQAIGGVAPVGHPERLLTLVDAALERYGVVWAAAGHPRAVFPTTFGDLLALTGGRAADVAGRR